jgi:beta-glucanase (GH16 family)
MDTVNGEVGGMLAPNVRVNNSLFIDSLYVPGGFQSGDSIQAPEEVFYSSGQFQQRTPAFLYGTVTARAKMPGGTGLWPLVWMLGYGWQPSQPYTANVPGHQWPHDKWCEIDIVEFLANSRTTNNCAVWFYNATTGNGSAEGGSLNHDADSRFMVYRLTWAQGLLLWEVDEEDGNGFHTLRTLSDPDQIPNVPMYVMLSTAIGGVVGPPNPATFPQTYELDYIDIIPA